MDGCMLEVRGFWGGEIARFNVCDTWYEYLCVICFSFIARLGGARSWHVVCSAVVFAKEGPVELSFSFLLLSN